MGNRRQQRGSVVVLALLALTTVVVLFALGVSVSFWMFKRGLVTDAAEAIAPPALRNQMTYRRMGNPNTETMIEEMAAEARLQERLHDVIIGVEFGYDDGSGFVPVGRNPNPATTAFNVARVQVCTPLDDVTGTFQLGEDRFTCAVATARVPVTEDCYCNHAVCASYHGLAKVTCLLGCTLGYTLSGLLHTLFTLDLGQLLDALDCVFESLVMTVDSTVTWVLGPDIIRIEYHSGG